MIWYSVFAVLFSAWVILLAVWGEKDGTRVRASAGDRWTSAAGGILAAAGTAGVLITYFTYPDREFAGWFRDTALAYLYVIAPVFVLLFAVGVISSLSSSRNPSLKKKAVHKLRIIMIAASSLFLVCLNYISFIGSNDKAPLTLYLLLFGAGLSAVMRAASVIERKIYHSGDKNEK